MLQGDPSAVFHGARPEGIGGDVGADHPLLAESRGAACAHGGRNRQRSNELLVILRDPAAGLRPEPLTIRVCQQNTGDHVRIESVDAVAQGLEDGVERGAPNDQFERLLVNDSQRVANER
jgi:hypothetical protein